MKNKKNCSKFIKNRAKKILTKGINFKKRTS